jgi:AraC family transcriptional regulator, ethanolamine operon transcriptional activator
VKSTRKNQIGVTVVEIRDPAQANAGIELVDFDAVQLQTMPLSVKRTVVELGTVTVMFNASNCHLRSRSSIADGQLAYVVFGPEAKGVINGIQVRPGLMLAVPNGVEATFVVEAGWESITFLVPAQAIHAHLADRRRRSEIKVLDDLRILAADPLAVSRLYDSGRQLTLTAEQQPEILTGYDGDLSGLQAAFLENILSTMEDAHSLKPAHSDRMRQRRHHLVRTAENYVVAQSGGNLYLTDLCRAARVSERTLEYAFREVMGMTPSAFLSRLRLHKVRQALLAAAPGKTTVSSEAMRWGFCHFGEFSKKYHDCFGELPSETLAGLRRQPASVESSPD